MRISEFSRQCSGAVFAMAIIAIAFCRLPITMTAVIATTAAVAHSLVCGIAFTYKDRVRPLSEGWRRSLGIALTFAPRSIFDTLAVVIGVGATIVIATDYHFLPVLLFVALMVSCELTAWVVTYCQAQVWR